jgi:hypothetical protein
MRRIVGTALAAILVVIAGNTPSARAKSPASGLIIELITLQKDWPANICRVITPVLLKSPDAAADVVNAARKYPHLLVVLAQCLSHVEHCYADPAVAATIAAIVASAPGDFRAAYAVNRVVVGGSLKDGLVTVSNERCGNELGSFGLVGIGTGVVSPSKP